MASFTKDYMKQIINELNQHFNQFDIRISRSTSKDREIRFTFNGNKHEFHSAISQSLSHQWTRQSPTQFFPGDPSNINEESYFMTNSTLNVAFNFKDKILDLA